MPLPRTFVGFSSTDIDCYRTMRMWTANENIDFNFADFQLGAAIESENKYLIKSQLRRKIVRSDTYLLLIGTDTYTQNFVKWEVDVAIETGCRLIGVNINNCRHKDLLCPEFFSNTGALFVPFSARIVAFALQPQQFDPCQPDQSDDWYFYDRTYIDLGYQLIGDKAFPTKQIPFLGGPPLTK